MQDRRVRASTRDPSPIDPSPGWFDLLAAAADPRRLVILGALREVGELSIDELSARVGARDGEANPDAGGDGDLVPADLYHVHLPKLVDVDLVEVDEGGEAISVRPGPAFEAETVEALERDVGSGAVDDATVAALEEPRRRLAVSALAAAGGTLDLDGLAEAVSERIPRHARPSEPTPDAAIMLHHVDLPKLAAAGVVEYDPGDRRVTYLGLPDALASAVASV